MKHVSILRKFQRFNLMHSPVKSTLSTEFPEKSDMLMMVPKDNLR